jgi:hypothetical protein
VSEQEPLRGAVAAILTDRELAINLGSDNGVKAGMKFAVLNSKGLDITDPTTEEPIGSIAIPKVIVEVSRVEPRVSVARTFKKRRRNIGGQGLGGLAGMGNLFDPPKYVDEWESLRTDQKPQIKELPESASYVERGDPVVQVLGDEYLTEAS